MASSSNEPPAPPLSKKWNTFNRTLISNPDYLEYSFCLRSKFPDPSYGPDLIKSRPAWFNPMNIPATIARGLLEKYFPKLPPRTKYSDMERLFDIDISTHLLTLYDIEGAIRKRLWLTTEQVLTGCRHYAQAQPEMIWIPQAIPSILGPNTHFSTPGPPKRMLQRRIILMPIHDDERHHWFLTWYDQRHNTVFTADTLTSNPKVQDATEGVWQKIFNHLNLPMDRQSFFKIKVTHQTDSYSCGVHVFDTVRRLLNENTEIAGENLPHGLVSWEKSIYQQDKSTGVATASSGQRMYEMHIFAFAAELGAIGQLRWPQNPTSSLDNLKAYAKDKYDSYDGGLTIRTYTPNSKGITEEDRKNTAILSVEEAPNQLRRDHSIVMVRTYNLSPEPEAIATRRLSINRGNKPEHRKKTPSLKKTLSRPGGGYNPSVDSGSRTPAVKKSRTDQGAIEKHEGKHRDPTPPRKLARQLAVDMQPAKPRPVAPNIPTWDSHPGAQVPLDCGRTRWEGYKFHRELEEWENINNVVRERRPPPSSTWKA